jgi:cytosine/creatinine deaminase
MTAGLPAASRYWLASARVPACFLAAPVVAPADEDGALLLDILVENGAVAAIEPAGVSGASLPRLDLGDRQLWPTLIDMHTHIDKGHIAPRTPNRDGSFAGAREGSSGDRTAYWNHEDIRRRMEFALRCAYVHGVSAIRTHLESHEGSAETGWAVFRELRGAWASRIALQAVSLVPIDVFAGDYGPHLADLVAASGGVLGAVTRASGGVHHGMVENLDTLLDIVFRLASERGLDLDFHVDESGDIEAAALPHIAEAVLRHGFKGRVVCGHCCSLALQSDEVAAKVIARCAEAGIAIVTLPTVNMYLQDRASGRTPRWRGVAPIKELRAAGVPVAIGGDNCRDPFHAYGDHDMVDTFQQAARIGHLDHPFGNTPAMAGPIPAVIIGAGPIGTIAKGAPARFILFRARSLNELMSRPQSDRVVIDRGVAVTDALPDYAELDDLVRRRI